MWVLYRDEDKAIIDIQSERIGFITPDGKVRLQNAPSGATWATGEFDRERDLGGFYIDGAAVKEVTPNGI